jgi:hypothetical protein
VAIVRVCVSLPIGYFVKKEVFSPRLGESKLPVSLALCCMYFLLYLVLANRPSSDCRLVCNIKTKKTFMMDFVNRFVTGKPVLSSLISPPYMDVI